MVADQPAGPFHCLFAHPQVSAPSGLQTHRPLTRRLSCALTHTTSRSSAFAYVYPPAHHSVCPLVHPPVGMSVDVSTRPPTSMQSSISSTSIHHHPAPFRHPVFRSTASERKIMNLIAGACAPVCPWTNLPAWRYTRPSTHPPARRATYSSARLLILQHTCTLFSSMRINFEGIVFYRGGGVDMSNCPIKSNPEGSVREFCPFNPMLHWRRYDRKRGFARTLNKHLSRAQLVVFRHRSAMHIRHGTMAS